MSTTQEKLNLDLELGADSSSLHHSDSTALIVTGHSHHITPAARTLKSSKTSSASV
ncbi:276_t:CDS:2, partial [Gigaspora rosea]